MIKKKALSEDNQRRKEIAESSLVEFIALVHPKRLLGNIHREIISWWTRSEAHPHQLLLLPRDHMKSALVAYRVAWELTKDPTLRILFISSTSNLATKQLNSLRIFLPQMSTDYTGLIWSRRKRLRGKSGRREKYRWTTLSVRRSLFVILLFSQLASLAISSVCTVILLYWTMSLFKSNAYLEEGRNKVKDQYSLLSSVESVNSQEWVVGTRYHPKDLYSTLVEMEIEEYDDDGNVNNLNHYLKSLKASGICWRWDWTVHLAPTTTLRRKVVRIRSRGSQ